MNIIQAVILSILAVFHGSNHRNAAVYALPNGSPVCIVGGPAVRASHQSNPNNITGSLASASFAVKIGNTTLNSTAINTIAANTDLPLVLSSVNGTQFRGVLIVLNQPNVSLISNLFISPNSTDYQPQVNCSMGNNAGFTQVGRTLKDNATATINLPFNQPAFLDVNVVVANNANISIFFYTRFQLNTPLPPPTKAPTKAPTKSPTMAPVKVPTKSPTKAPVKATTKSPTKAPTKAPTKTPTTAPTRKACGLFRLSIICFKGCGLFRRLFGLC